VLQGDAHATGLPRASFDLTTARLVLVNVPEPEQIVAEMVALVRPGGMVALHEADYVSHLCDAPHPAWSRLMQALETYAQENGIDLFIGRRVPRLLREAGLMEVQTHPIVSLHPPGHAGRSTIHARNQDRSAHQKTLRRPVHARTGDLRYTPPRQKYTVSVQGGLTLEGQPCTASRAWSLRVKGWRCL
jgi:SAM-dependent methyltransferase